MAVHPDSPSLANSPADIGARGSLRQRAAGQCRLGQPIALTIAGLDPSSGAGLTADLKVFAAHGLYGVAAPTALTVQSTAGVRHVEPVSASLLAQTLACLAEDLPIAGIKIGMLATAANVDAVADFLESLKSRDALPVVLDPVIRSSSGYALLDREGVNRLQTRLLPLVSCTTPNFDELMLLAEPGSQASHPGSLTGTDPSVNAQVVEQAAANLAQLFPGLGIIATGGHLTRPDDCILAPGLPLRWQTGAWVETTATHGTGCGYSSALLCGLVQGHTLIEAAQAAKHYVAEALRAATPMGKSGGAMHHLYAARPSQPSYPSIHDGNASAPDRRPEPGSDVKSEE